MRSAGERRRFRRRARGRPRESEKRETETKHGCDQQKTKGKAGAKAAKAAAKSPQFLLTGTKIAVPAGKAGLKASKPVMKRRARKRADQLDRASRTIGEALAVHAPKAAYDLGLADPPKRKRTTPRVVAGVMIGASAMYFLEPGHGKEHREKVAQLVG